MAQRGPTRPTARIEEAIGFVGMFGLLFLGVTVFCEVTGRPAFGWALTLLASVVGLVLLDRWRVSVLRRTASEDGIGGQPAPRTAPSAPVAQTTPAVRAADVHRHVGWDDLDASRVAGRSARRAARDARRDHLVDARRPSDG